MSERPTLLPVFAAVTLSAFVFSGCDQSSDGESAAPDASPSPAAPATPEPAPAPAATPAPEAPAPSPEAAPDAPSATGEAAEPAIELPDPVAVVNGQPITLAQLQEAFDGALAGAGIDPSMLSNDQKLAGYNQLVEDLIIDQLIQAQADGIEIGDEEVAEEIATIKSQFPSEETFTEQLAQSGQTEEGLADLIKEGMKQRRWIESQIGEEAKPDAEAAKKFYEENPGEFDQPASVRASHILFMVPEGADEATVEAKLTAAKEAAKRANDGEDFETLAKELSEEPGASESGGDLDFFTKDRMVPEFAEAAFGMDVDQISEPVKTQFGWHVIKVTDKRDAGKVPFEEVQDQLTAFLETRQQQEAVTKVIDELRQSANVEVKLPKPETPAEPQGPAPGVIGSPESTN